VRAPGAPGVSPGWGPGRKQGFGAAPGSASRVWFTIAQGNLSEVFYPTLDRPVLHGLRFLVASPGVPPLDDSVDAEHSVRWVQPGLPCFRVESRHVEYSLEAEYLPDPDGDAILVAAVFRPELPDVRLYLQAAPHDVADAAVLDREPPVLVARQGQTWIALVGPFSRCSTGYLQSSDLFVDLHDNDGLMTAEYTSATRGHVALGAELGLAGGAFQLGLGFGVSRDAAEEAAHDAVSRGASAVREALARAWRARPTPDGNVRRVAGDDGALALASMTVLFCLEDKQRPGAFITAPAAAWGDPAQPYTLVCNRDLYHVATALLDAGDRETPQRTLTYLESTQREDGSWPVRYRITGASQADGVALDQVAYPILLAWRLGVVEALDHDPYPRLVRRAAAYLVNCGPATDADRWLEGGGGYSPSALAVAVAALLVAAEFAEDARETAAAEHLRAVADYWQEQIERWTYDRAAGRYVRLAPDREAGVRPEDPSGVEFLELVRRGLRRPSDPRIVKALAAVDAELRVVLPCGEVWRRFSGDTHGETDEGVPPWQATRPGRGRPWPVLIGERAHHALAAGESAVEYVRRLEACAGPELLLPEQIWDAGDLPERCLFTGRATGSVAPLAWAHAEYLRLLAAIAGSRLPDLLEPVARRYLKGAVERPPFVWSHAHRIRTFPEGRRVRVQLRRRATVLWTLDGWKTSQVAQAQDTGLGCWVADLPTQEVPAGGVVEWTASYADGRWEESDHQLQAMAEPVSAAADESA
jgi:glucoamylase